MHFFQAQKILIQIYLDSLIPAAEIHLELFYKWLDWARKLSGCLTGTDNSLQQTTYSATPINLRVNPLTKLLTHQNARMIGSDELEYKELSRSADFNGTEHIRIQQFYQGVPVLGADAVIHKPANRHKYLQRQLLRPLHRIHENTKWNGRAVDDMLWLMLES